MSENEVDIGASLFDDVDQVNNTPASGSNQQGFGFDAEGLYDDDDEAFIALQQAASFRKSSNVKGKSVKKGGGFQAMGALHRCRLIPSRPPLTSSKQA